MPNTHTPDEVTHSDKLAASALITGQKVGGGDGQTYTVRTPTYKETCEAFARHRIASTRAVDTELLEALKAATAAIEDGTGLDDAIGHDCGCRGLTNRDLLLHGLRAAITKAEAGS